MRKQSNGAAPQAAKTTTTVKHVERIPGLSLELDFFGVQGWGPTIPTALLIDGSGRVYLERGENRKPTAGAGAGLLESGIFTDSGDWKQIKDVEMGDIQPTTVRAALEWYARSEPYAEDSSGTVARLCGMAADALA